MEKNRTVVFLVRTYFLTSFEPRPDGGAYDWDCLPVPHHSYLASLLPLTIFLRYRFSHYPLWNLFNSWVPPYVACKPTTHCSDCIKGLQLFMPVAVGTIIDVIILSWLILSQVLILTQPSRRSLFMRNFTVRASRFEQRKCNTDTWKGHGHATSPEMMKLLGLSGGHDGWMDGLNAPFICPLENLLEAVRKSVRNLAYLPVIVSSKGFNSDINKLQLHHDLRLQSLLVGQPLFCVGVSCNSFSAPLHQRVLGWKPIGKPCARRASPHLLLHAH